jgi:phospholipid-binding lipoprotein MlaA
MRKQRLIFIGIRGAALLLLVVFSFGCAAVPVQQDPEPPAQFPVSEIVKEDVTYSIDAYDPWEGMNRRIYKFNAIFDEYVYLKVVRGYRFLTPVFVQDMVSNFFNNLHEVTTLINSLLQLKGQKFAITLSRMMVNTTLGVGGAADVATSADINRQKEDFGQTLGYYGSGPGPYLVLPVFGPSTVRDGAGLGVDAVTFNLLIGELADLANLTWQQELAVNALDAIDTRHQIQFRYYGTGSPFEYDLIRMLYLKKREIEIAN